MLVEPNHNIITVSRQCEVLGLPRSTFYYQPCRDTEVNEFLMKVIDRQYTKTPFYGYRRMTARLREMSYPVNEKRVIELMNQLGLVAIYPKKRKNLSDGIKKYPYLLKGVEILRPDQVWSADITYIPMRRGFLYLFAIIDLFSRYVVAWSLSSSMDADFCVDALKEALERATPEIMNTDQGSQFTAIAFTHCLVNAGVKISMDGKGRVFDNIFVERLWRSVKYEEVYLREYVTPREAEKSLDGYFRFYNEERLHQALDYMPPARLYLPGRINNPGSVIN